MRPEACFGDNWFTARLADLIRFGRDHSLYPLPFGTACCGIEHMAVTASRYDRVAFDSGDPRISPREADCLIVAGAVPLKTAPLLRLVYDQLLEPRYVISMGACASCGGFEDDDAPRRGVDAILPVDVHLPGCPPRPEALLDALIRLRKTIERPPLPADQLGGSA